MKALIVEDEKPAQEALIRIIGRVFPYMEIAAVTETVSETLAWLRSPGNTPDLIFMDVELPDGTCFEIFRQEPVHTRVIMTTAYDKYAIEAFEAGSIDYLLKPVEDEALRRAVNRVQALSENDGLRDLVDRVQQLVQTQKTEDSPYRKRFIIHVGKKIIPISTEEIAYFYVEGKYRYITRRDGLSFYFDRQIESVLEELDPQLFFRVSRNYIVSLKAIQGFEHVLGSRLKIHLLPPLKEEIIVARSRVREFKKWIS